MALNMNNSLPIYKEFVNRLYHQIKNPLTTVQTSADLMLNQNKQSSIAKECHTAISNSVSRIDRYLIYLETLSNSNSSIASSILLDDVVSDTYGLFKKIRPKTITLQTHPTDQLSHTPLIMNIAQLFKSLILILDILNENVSTPIHVSYSLTNHHQTLVLTIEPADDSSSKQIADNDTHLMNQLDQLETTHDIHKAHDCIVLSINLKNP